MQDQVQKAIKLAKKTGDRIIVVDSSNPEDVFVVMSLDEYEKLVIGGSEVRNLTEDELLDKINRDIAIWKSDTSANVSEKNNKILESECDDLQNEDYDDFDDELEDNFEEENMYYYDKPDKPFLNELSFTDKKDSFENKFKNSWNIPSNIKESAEEIIEDEDKF